MSGILDVAYYTKTMERGLQEVFFEAKCGDLSGDGKIVGNSETQLPGPTRTIVGQVQFSFS